MKKCTGIIFVLALPKHSVGACMYVRPQEHTCKLMHVRKTFSLFCKLSCTLGAVDEN